MPIADRVDLIRADATWLTSIQPEPPAGRWTRAFSNQNGAVIHDLVNTTHWIISCADQHHRHPMSGEMLSRMECAILAWRRGGHEEYKRISKLQQQIARAAKPARTKEGAEP